MRLDQASTLLRWQVAQRGALICAAPEAAWVRFRAAVGSEYEEYAETVARPAEIFLDRLTRGGA